MTERIVNNFSITVGTSNGSGSQTSNTTILRTIFKMGIPVSGKNLFPSNIQGLPTWYTIRASKDGFTARRDEHEIVIAMNPTSFARDLASVEPGGVFMYADDIKQPVTREDITVYAMPVKQLVRSDASIPTNLRDMIANMVYVGILAFVIKLDMGKVYEALNAQFKGKKKAVELNFNMVKIAHDWAAANIEKKDPYYVEAMNKTHDLIMADGNTAGALGAIYGGVQFVGWYPITPATSLAESLNEYLPQLRKDAEGKNTYAVVQSEDELAAIGMCIGAGWSGLRAMTSTSGPGLSLMTEFAGLAYYAEVPLVIWDVTRIGPSTGMPTRTSQGDIAFAANMGHGDIDAVMLLPGSVSECFEYGWRAFDVAERLQTPVLVMSDLDFGMNQWATEPFKYPETPMDRGKILWEDDMKQLTEQWGRYLDKDGDGIPYRTLPGNRIPGSAYFARGTSHDAFAKYTEDSGIWETNMNRIKKKFITALEYLPKPEVKEVEGAKEAFITFGSTIPAVEEARYLLVQQLGRKSSSLYLKAYPFASEVKEFVQKYEKVYVVEMNRDGQMCQLLTLAMPELATKLVSVAYSDGLPATAKRVVKEILAKEAK